MKLSVNYYRGIKTAEIPITPVTLVAGDNHQGKSSIAQAAAALFTGSVLPDWCKKKDAAKIVNDESGTGLIELATDGGTVSIEYPSCKISTIGRPPYASPVAAGMTSPIDMSERDRSSYYAELLKTDPTETDLREAIAVAGLADEQFTSLWKSVQSTGWDAAWSHAKSKGIEIKGAWKHVTGEQYGSVKASNWTPGAWSKVNEKMKPSDVEKKIAALQKERDESIRRTAVDESEIDRLKQYADGLADAEANVKDNKKRLEEISEKIEALRSQIPEIPVLNDQPCPHCEQPLSIKNGKIMKGGAVKQADVDKAVKQNADIEKQMSELNDKMAIYNADYQKSLALMGECKAAVEKLKTIGSQKKQSGRFPDEIDIEIESLRDDINMITAKSEADKYHQQIERNAVICDALAPEGLRKTALESGLSKLNDALAVICKTAKWKTVEVQEDLSTDYDGRQYEALSQSEQYRVLATLQLAIAGIDKSDIMIFDGADIMMKAGRNGLISAVLKSGVPAIICMSFLDRKDVPDMSKIGGISVWVDNGEVKRTHKYMSANNNMGDLT
jgi:predicted translin family RNA/ssDNA-binding protein